MTQSGQIAGKMRWVQGHFINEHLGGRGEQQNLAPFTRSLNTRHYHAVEKHVIKAIGAGKAVDYSVKAIPSGPGTQNETDAIGWHRAARANYPQTMLNAMVAAGALDAGDAANLTAGVAHPGTTATPASSAPTLAGVEANAETWIAQLRAGRVPRRDRAAACATTPPWPPARTPPPRRRRASRRRTRPRASARSSSTTGADGALRRPRIKPRAGQGGVRSDGRASSAASGRRIGRRHRPALANGRARGTAAAHTGARSPRTSARSPRTSARSPRTSARSARTSARSARTSAWSARASARCALAGTRSPRARARRPRAAIRSPGARARRPRAAARCCRSRARSGDRRRGVARAPPSRLRVARTTLARARRAGGGRSGCRERARIGQPRPACERPANAGATAARAPTRSAARAQRRAANRAPRRAAARAHRRAARRLAARVERATATGVWPAATPAAPGAAGAVADTGVARAPAISARVTALVAARWSPRSTVAAAPPAAAPPTAITAATLMTATFVAKTPPSRAHAAQEARRERAPLCRRRRPRPRRLRRRRRRRRDPPRRARTPSGRHSAARP